MILRNSSNKPVQIDKVLKGLDSSLDFEAMFRAALKAL